MPPICWRMMDELEARRDAEAKLNAIIEAAGKQMQQLIRHYAEQPDATPSGLAFLHDEAVAILQSLIDEKKRMLGDG
jgi:hypothetical protein